ncbi:glycosyltransferase family 2 protein [Caulobacter sp. DWR1-3-2b1]|uniref:glycosyltransferase family 2 protein n=1 Tax=Caulobacter sp. DWR1-3-2b1 TaxID=2804670 RepID=UPI003CE7C952
MSVGHPVVSVVMANYNGARHLNAALDSVLNQTLSDLELIVVDDVSTDESVAVLQTRARLDSRLTVLPQPRNQGPAAARNRGLDAARGRWIAIVDSDDELAPDRLACLVARAAADGARIVADNQMVFTETGAFEPYPMLPPDRFAAPVWITPAQFIEGGVMYGPGPDFGYLKPLIERSLLAELRYDESLRIGEDYDLLLRLMLRAGRLRLEPAALYRYRKHPQSISHRLTPAALTDMLTAQDRFRAEFPNRAPELREALTRRARSLEKARAYETVISGLKEGAIVSSLMSAVGQPQIWALLTQPLRARLDRFAAARRQSTVRA